MRISALLPTRQKGFTISSATRSRAWATGRPCASLESIRHQSPNGVMCHLKSLEKKGLDQARGLSALAIQLLDITGPARVPFLGRSRRAAV